MTSRIPSGVRIISILLGLGLLFIGGRFLLLPEAAELGYGLHYDQPNYAFHAIKGVRDVFSGLIIILLAWYQYRHPLFLTLLTGSLIPVVDMLIVRQTPDSNPWAMLIHGGTAVTLWILCYFLAKPKAPSTPGSVA